MDSLSLTHDDTHKILFTGNKRLTPSASIYVVLKVVSKITLRESQFSYELALAFF